MFDLVSRTCVKTSLLGDKTYFFSHTRYLTYSDQDTIHHPSTMEPNYPFLQQDTSHKCHN